MNGQFIITYTDGDFYTGSLFAKDWNKAPIKPIEEIRFTFAENSVMLKGYQSYNLTWESYAVLGKNAPIIHNITLASRSKIQSTLFIFNFRTKQVIKKHTKIGQEYGNMTSNTWKDGNPNGLPQDFIL